MPLLFNFSFRGNSVDVWNPSIVRQKTRWRLAGGAGLDFTILQQLYHCGGEHSRAVRAGMFASQTRKNRPVASIGGSGDVPCCCGAMAGLCASLGTRQDGRRGELFLESVMVS